MVEVVAYANRESADNHILFGRRQSAVASREVGAEGHAVSPWSSHKVGSVTFSELDQSPDAPRLEVEQDDARKELHADHGSRHHRGVPKCADQQP